MLLLQATKAGVRRPGYETYLPLSLIVLRFALLLSPELFHFIITVEPPNRGHFGTVAFVLSSEVVLFSEVV